MEKLRTRKRQWPRTRWLVLVLGVAALAATAAWGRLLFVVLAGLGSARLDSTGVVLISYVVTKCMLMFLFGIWCFAVVWQGWHGNMQRVLLLRLQEAQQNSTNGRE